MTDSTSTDVAASPDELPLSDDDREAFEAVLTGRAPGPLAVVGAPFAGRERLLDHAEERLDATRIRLAPGDDAGSIDDAIGETPVVVDDCHHLYRRAIGGFDSLEAFLGRVVGADAPVVTGWNRYAWAYLSAVKALDRAFPARVDVGPETAERLAELLLSRYDELPSFVDEKAEQSGAVAVRRFEFGWGDRSFSVPIPVPTFLAASRTGARPDPKDVVFERLAAVSGGNVGVATALWERGLDDVVRPSDVGATGTDLSFDREEAFCLRIVLSKERVERAELAAVVDADLDRVLPRFVREGVVTVSDGVVALDPAAVPTAATATERRRFQ
ncbi:hypothetical protein [Salinirarus marinus]|uniref:hypothetical protein n=1 Tax=Salinirarus marinus TaxID=3068310 RepID=UPI003C6CBAFE